MAIVRGIGNWAKVYKPSIAKDGFSSQYQIDVVVTDKEAARIKDEYGIVARKKDNELVVKVKTEALDKDGFTPNDPPVVVDAGRVEMKTPIGNGSKVNVSFYPHAWKYAGKTGVSAILKAVQVVELVKLEQSGLDDFVEEAGYKDESKSKPSSTSDSNDAPFDTNVFDDE